MKIKEIS